MIKIKNKGYIKLEIKYNISKTENLFNIGLSILRPILSFFVIMIHLCRNTEVKKLFIFVSPVRVFFIMSFYFTYKTFISSDYKKKFERLLRLSIPYFLWPIIFFYLDRILKNYIYIKTLISVKLLKKQLLIFLKPFYPFFCKNINRSSIYRSFMVPMEFNIIKFIS